MQLCWRRDEKRTKENIDVRAFFPLVLFNGIFYVAKMSCSFFLYCEIFINDESKFAVSNNRFRQIEQELCVCVCAVNDRL